MHVEQGPLNETFVAVYEALGLVQERQIDQGLALLDSLGPFSRDLWTMNVLGGSKKLRRAQSLVGEAKKQCRAGRRDLAAAAWESAEYEALGARGEVELVTMTKFGRMEDPWRELVDEFDEYVQEERVGAEP